MSETRHTHPDLLDPAELVDRLGQDHLRIVDLTQDEVFREHHVPGAVQLPYAALVRNAPPVGGLLPPQKALLTTIRALGIDNDTHVVAMDAEGGGAAGRLIWTLELLGHQRLSLLDGGLRAWVSEGYPTESGPGKSMESGDFNPGWHPEYLADADWIMPHLGDAGTVLLDARSLDEYDGTLVRAARGGHIPGAVHYEWTAAMDKKHHLRLRNPEIIQDELEAVGITPDREIVTYCHTHHRSAFSYAMLRVLGFARVRGYPGSWSDWGNRDDTPVE